MSENKKTVATEIQDKPAPAETLTCLCFTAKNER